jgi:putative ABC transport system substrate-binding protein
MMRRRRALLGAAAALVGAVAEVCAQSGRRTYRVGFLGALTEAAVAERVKSFRDGLRDLGYVEGRDLVLEFRWANGRMDLLPALAAELVRLPVDVIVTGGPAATRPARAATASIPIVMTMDNDPVAAGHASSLARPGGNVTGVSRMAPVLAGKQLEILKEMVPSVARVLVLGSSSEPGNAEQLQGARRTAGTLGLTLDYHDVSSAQDIETGFLAALERRTGGALVLTSPLLVTERTRTVALARRHRLPTVFADREAAREGALATYGVNNAELFRRAAGYVDRILRGASPAEMAIEQPTNFELLVNARVADELGLALPQSLLLRAHEVIR